jgi:Tol biopolymer transport system component
MRRSRLAGIVAITAAAYALLPCPAVARQTTRVSVDSSGGEADYHSQVGNLSANGNLVGFTSRATNLVAGDRNGTDDAFVHDCSTGLTERVSVDSSGAEGNYTSVGAWVSADEDLVGFTSLATNLVAGDQNGTYDAFVHQRSTGLTERISVSSTGAEGDRDSLCGMMSANGSLVVFASRATNLVPGDTNGVNDIFVRDRVLATTIRVSVDSSGAQGDLDCRGAAISADGRIVLFGSQATNLVPGDTNGKEDMFVHDLATGITERVSVDSLGAQSDGFSFHPSLSSDGQIVAFASDSTNLVSGDTNGKIDVFVHDRSTGLTERVSVDSTGKQGNDDSMFPWLTADGRSVSLMSWATNLVAGDTNSCTDAFLHDRSTGRTERLSVDSSGAEANGASTWPILTPDGAFVAFASLASNLVAGDKNGWQDVFVHELCSSPASWSNYGTGFPGTFGVPSFTPQQNPVLGTTITLDLANSWQQPTVGLLFVGFQHASLHSGWGGDLLVVPAITQLITFSYGFDQFVGDIPDDATLCTSTLDLQVIEADPGAAKGVSFTPGLELVLGR